MQYFFKYKLLLSTLLLLCFLCFTHGYSQKYSFEPIKIKGSSQKNRVHCLFKDSRGLLWVGTENGIGYYVGSGIRFLDRKSLIKPNQKINSMYFQILETPDKHIWAAGMEGILEYNPENDKVLIHQDSTETESNAKTFLTQRLILHGEELWFLSHIWGLGKINIYSKKIDFFDLEDDISGANTTATVSFINISDTTFLISSQTKGLFIFNIPSKKAKKILLKDIYPNMSVRLRDVYKDANGKIWVGSMTDGIYILDADLKMIKHLKFFPEKEFQPLITGFFTDYLDKNKLWIYTNNGAYQTDINTYTFVSKIESEQSRNSISSNNIYDVKQYDPLCLWISTDNGLFKHNYPQFPIKKLRESENPDLKNKTFSVISKYKNDKILLANELEMICFNPSDQTSYKVANIFKNSVEELMFSLDYDPQYGIWFSTNKGLYHVNESKKTIEKATLGNGQNIEIWTLKIVSGKVLMGTAKNGMCVYDIKQQEFKSYLPDKKEEIPYSSSVGPVLKIGDSIIVGFTRGAKFFDCKLNKYYDFELPLDETTIQFYQFNVIEIKMDENKCIWFASNTGIFYLPRPYNKIFKLPLPADVSEIGNIIVKNQKIWYSAASSFNVFDLKENKNYSLLSGTNANTLIYNGEKVENDGGSCYLISDKGILHIELSKFKKDVNRAGIHLSKVELFDSEIVPMKGGIIEKPIYNLPNINLSHNENTLKFYFDLLDFYNPLENQFQYRLIGFNDTWIENYHENSIVYTNLPPGKFTLEIKAMNSFQSLSDKVLRININIKPAFWQTIWFKAIIGLVLLMIALSVFYVRTKSIVRRNRLLKQLVNERTKEIEVQNEEIKSINEELKSTNDYLTKLNKEKSDLIGIVSHDLKAPLNRAEAFVSILLQSNLHLDDTQSKMFNGLKKEIANEKALISDILNMEEMELNISNTIFKPLDLSEILNECVMGFKNMAVDKNIVLNYHALNKECVIHAEETQLKRIFDNLISNSLKFSPPNKSVNVKLEETITHFIVKIQDEGPGFSDYDKDNAFKKYSKLSAKPTGGESSTGLGLAIVKLIVENMRAKITLESEKDKGATFSILFLKPSS